MEAILQSLLADSHGLAAYLTVFGILVVCGLGVPLPEDISLILGGYLAYQGSADLTVMMVVGFLGILVGDSLIYLVGRRLGERPSTGWLGKIITPEKRAVVAGMFEKHGRKVVMIARFMPGVRAVTYFTAGSVKMNYFQFIFWDGLAAIVSAPLFIYLGYRFGDEMDLLMAKVKEGQFAVLAVLAVVAVGAWIWHRRRKARAQGAMRLVDVVESAADPAAHRLPEPAPVPGDASVLVPGAALDGLAQVPKVDVNVMAELATLSDAGPVSSRRLVPANEVTQRSASSAAAVDVPDATTVTSSDNELRPES